MHINTSIAGLHLFIGRNTDCGASNETLVPTQKWPESSFLKRNECCHGVIHESSVHTRMNGFRNRPLRSGKQSFRAVLSTESCSGLCLTRLMCGSTGDVFYRSLQIHFVKRVFSETLSEEVKLWFGCSDVDRRSHRSAAIHPRPASVMWRCYHGDAAAVVMEREWGGLFPELLAAALMHVYTPRLFLQHVPSSRLTGTNQD